MQGGCFLGKKKNSTFQILRRDKKKFLPSSILFLVLDSTLLSIALVTDGERKLTDPGSHSP